MGNDQPLVSVVIPCYNQMQESRLLVCLVSVVEQTYDNFEVIVVDDASTDGSYEFCQEFAQKFEKRTLRFITDGTDYPAPVVFKILQHLDENGIATNKGLAASRNLGIYQSQGEYIALLDADDSWSHDKLSIHMEHFNKAAFNIGISFSCTEYVVSGRDNTKRGKVVPDLKLLNPSFEDILFNNPICNGSSPVIKKQVFRDVLLNAIPLLPFASEDEQRPLYFDESLDRAEDLDCWLRVYNFTDWRFEGIPEVLTYYWYNPKGSSLSSNLTAQGLAIQRVINKLCGYSSLEVKELKQLNTLAYAYMYKYLARQACRSYNPVAWEYVSKMLQNSLQPLRKEPLKVLKLCLTSLLILLIPSKVLTFIK